MRERTKEEQDALWEEVRKEFPNDETMQQVHYVRQMHYLQTRDLSPEKRVSFYAQLEKAEA